MKDIEFLYDDLRLEEKKLNEFAKIAEKKPIRTDFNALILRKFTKALFEAARRKYKKPEVKTVELVKRPTVTPIKQKVLQRGIRLDVPVPKVKLVAKEARPSIPVPQFTESKKLEETEYPLVVTLDTNKILVKAVFKNNEYFVEEPTLTNSETQVVTALKFKIGSKLIKKPETANDKQLLMNLVQKLSKKYNIPFNTDNYERLRYFLIRDSLGYGKIDTLFKDKNIREIRCDVVNKPVVVTYKDIENVETNITFDNKEQLERLIKKLFEMSKQKIKSGVNYLDVDLPGLKIKAMMDTAEGNLNFDIKKI
ncbi:MAG: hypothetical protein WC413_02335 [Candidatus Nanoarchaeia archaeon]